MTAGFWIRLGCLSAAALVVGAAEAAGDAAAGQWKVNTCLGCHGVENYFSVYPSYRVPKISGQHGDYIVAALKDYRTGARKHPTMRANASALSDQDIDDIAAYLSGEPIAQPAPDTSVDKPEQPSTAAAPAPDKTAAPVTTAPTPSETQAAPAASGATLPAAAPSAEAKAKAHSARRSKRDH